MANSGSPYRRLDDGNDNSWESLLNKVNEELQNPPEDSDCEPIDPIEVPGPDHRWAKSDIREVHEKLNQMPGDCFTFEPIPDRWKVSIIEDIEDQLSNSWCDCEDDIVCCYPCENAGAAETIFLLSFDTQGDCSPILDHCEGTGSACRTANLTPALTAYNAAKSDYSEASCEYCSLVTQIAEAEDELSALESERDACPEGAAGDACRAALDIEITAKESEITALEADRDAAESARDAAKVDLLNGSSDTQAAVIACISSGAPSCATLVTPDEMSPLDAEDCDTLPNECCGCDPFDCEVGWNLQRRNIVTGIINFTSDWASQAVGHYDIEGNVVVTGWNGECCYQIEYSCASNNCGSITCPNNYVYEYRLIKSYPFDFPAFTCPDGDPCPE